MKNLIKRSTGGFTLIELLVVVLIIGILSAIALPQYEKAVWKSRAAGAWSVLKTFEQAKDAYCLENPEGMVTTYAGDSKFVVDIPNIKDFGTPQVFYHATDGKEGTSAECKNQVVRVGPTDLPGYGYITLAVHQGKRYCGAHTAKGVEFCKMLGTTQGVTVSNWSTWILSAGSTSMAFSD